MKLALSFPGCHRKGGIERVVLETANYLQGRGHEVHLFSHDWDDVALNAGVVRHYVALFDHLPGARALTYARNAGQELSRAGKFDLRCAFGALSPPGGVIWVPSVHKAWVEISRRGRNLKGKLLQTLNPFHRAILGLEERRYRGMQYQRYLAHTPQVKQDLMHHYRVAEERITILPNGYSEREFNLDVRISARDSTRRELNFARDDVVVLFVANETERKGFMPLLQALGHLRDPRLRLLAVGRLPAPDPNAVAAAGMTGRVHMVAPTSSVARYYAAADLFALPTKYEAWGLVIVEALACGLPVLTSRLAGASVAVQDGVNGALLDDPTNVGEIAAKLADVIRLRAQPPELIARGVSTFTWSAVLEQYEQILVAESRRG